MTETSEVLRRYFRTDLDVAEDGRTIEGCAVPFDVSADVVDPDGRRYREKFAAGAFRRATRAPQRHELLLYEHAGMREPPALADIVGTSVSYEERTDGLFGAWRVNDGPLGDHALGLVRSGVLAGLSVGFVPLGPGRRDPDGTLVRTACHLQEVSLTRSPAYKGAEVVTIRSIPSDVPDRLDKDGGLDDRLRALGFEV